MSREQPVLYQRNALAPSLLAAAVLFVAPALLESDWFLTVRFVTAIFALIVGWFAVQARHWWWVPVFAAIAVLWNPVFPFAFEGGIWLGAQFAAAVAFLAAGATIKVRRD
ncbi:hypothetical protein BKA24_000473 [Microbacterium marinum]|uniref:Uncharacterized protein n=1 Tax=Microbacterium marinum TaxID=421115 RepID=A0A7W7BQ90_9MICO|nr:hypothetical protein [Microbacterium marinum]